MSCVFGGLFYFLHPAQAESIAWASSLKDVLSTFFSLLILIYYLRQRQSNKSIPLLFLLVPLALLTKPNSIVVIPLLCILEYFTFNRKLSKNLLLFIPFIIGFIYLHITRSFSMEDFSIFRLLHSTVITEKLLTISAAIGIYTQKIIIPFPIYFFTFGQTTITNLPILFLPPLILLFTVIFYHRKERKLSVPLFCTFYFLITISPHIGIINNYFQENFSIISSRYLNLPLASFALFVVWINIKLVKKFGTKAHIPFILLVYMFSYMQMRQTSLWKTSSKILEYSALHSPPNRELFFAISAAYKDEGKNRMSRFWMKKAARIKSLPIKTP